MDLEVGRTLTLAAETSSAVTRLPSTCTAPAIASRKALLAIAAEVQRNGKHVTTENVAVARAQAATDMEVHDMVLIAAAFYMDNRHVDGLATWQPRDKALYRERGRKTAREVYISISGESLQSKMPQL